MKADHLHAVDGLRGFAALTVIVYHLFTNTGNTEWRPLFHVNLLRPIHDGWAGVNLFLVLSGFCLYWPYANNGDRKLAYFTHMKRRSLRLLPAYYASLILVPAIYWFMRSFGLSVSVALPGGFLDVGSHLLLMHSLWDKSIYSWNGVTWSLGLEWIWYLIFPAAVWLFRKQGALNGILFCAIATVIYRCALYAILGPAANLGLEFSLTLRTFILGRLFEFAVGMWVADRIVKGGISPKRMHVATVLLIIGIVGGRLGEHVDNFLPVRDMMYGIASGAGLVLAVGGTGLFHSFFSSQVLRWVGEGSYSLYLFHMPFVSLTAIGINQLISPGPARFAWSLLVLPLIVIAVRPMYHLVEEPFMRKRDRQPLSDAVQTRVEGSPLISLAEGDLVSNPS